jgi:hypothetical protein
VRPLQVVWVRDGRGGLRATTLRAAATEQRFLAAFARGAAKALRLPLLGN